MAALPSSPHVIERVRTTDGKILYSRSPQSLGRIVDARYVAMMNAMMHETLVIGTARHANLPGWQAAGKTGTSQDFRDAWFIGYTSRLVTGIWLGNDDSSPTRKATGGGLPVDIWSRFMQVALRGVAPAPLPGLGGGWLSPGRPQKRRARQRRRRTSPAASIPGCSTSCSGGTQQLLRISAHRPKPRRCGVPQTRGQAGATSVMRRWR